MFFFIWSNYLKLIICRAYKKSCALNVASIFRENRELLCAQHLLISSFATCTCDLHFSVFLGQIFKFQKEINIKNKNAVILQKVLFFRENFTPILSFPSLLDPRSVLCIQSRTVVV